MSNNNKRDDFMNIEVNFDQNDNYKKPIQKRVEHVRRASFNKIDIRERRLKEPQAKSYLFQGINQRMKQQDPDKLIANYDPTPSRQIQQKIDYFYMSFPDQKYSISKSMKF